MIGSILVWLLTTVALMTVTPTEAQQPEKIFRIGFLDSSTASGSAVLCGGVPARAEQAWLD